MELQEAHKNANRAPLRPRNLATLLLSAGGLGFLRPMPGTWGSLPPPAAASVVVLLVYFGAVDREIAPVMYYGVIGGLLVLASIACVTFGRYAERRFALPSGEPQKDAPEVVADEVAGQAVALLAVWPRFLTDLRLASEDGPPAQIARPAELIGTLAVIGLAFVAFRAFDIVKPWPVRALEKLPHGWGVLLDDVAAGVYAAVVVILGQWVMVSVLP